MSENLISLGIINPSELSLEKVKKEVAAFLKVSTYSIIKIECWRSQIWVKIKGIGSKFVSYRCLPIWIEAAIATIKNCKDQASLDQLGNILRHETQKYSQYYPLETIQNLRYLWAEQAKFIKKESEYLAPIIAHREAAIKWQQSWVEVLNYCHNSTSLMYLNKEIQIQSQQFSDFQEIIQPLAELLQQRWQAIDKFGVG